MTSRNSLQVFFFVTVVFLMAGSDVFGQTTGRQNSNAKTIPLENMLVRLGEKYDRHFTIEEGEDKIRPSNWILTSRILENQGGDTFVDELTNACKGVPNVTFRFDEQNPLVVHLIDTRLTKLNFYPMASVIFDLEFSGPVGDFVDDLRCKGWHISILSSGDTYELGHIEKSTDQDVARRGNSVRSALSNYLQLEMRQRIIWIARTNLEGTPESNIFYNLPLR